MSDSDARFLSALEAGRIGNSEFRHRDHVRAAWLYLMRDGFPNAIPIMERTIRRFASHHGQESKFHLTLTVAWVKLVAAHVACHRHSAFDEFIAANGELLDKNLTLRFYSRERLFSDLARSRWIDPDLRSLPKTSMKKDGLRIVLELHRAAHQIGLFIDRRKGPDVTQAEAIILAFLHKRRKATMSELHRAFGHKRSTLTSVVDRLVARGLATRDLSPEDRRSFVVTLSKRGAAVASELHRLLAALEAEALKDVSDRDVAMFRSLMARLDADQKRRPVRT